MNIIKGGIISTVLILVISVNLKAQRIDTLTLQEKQRLTDALVSNQISFKKQVFYDPLVGSYTIEPNGINSSHGHFFMRIKEPDMSRVIPMPKTKLELSPVPNFGPSPFSALSKQKLPQISNRE